MTANGLSRPKTVKIWLKLANFDVFFTFTPSNALLGSVRQEIIGIVKKDSFEHKGKKLPLKKDIQREKKVLKIAESTIFKFFLAFNTSAMSMTFSK